MAFFRNFWNLTIRFKYFRETSETDNNGCSFKVKKIKQAMGAQVFAEFEITSWFVILDKINESKH